MSVGVIPLEMFGDRGAHALRIVQHLVVPEPQHPVPLAFQEPGAAGFLLGGGVMLAAVDLDDQPRFVAGEVSDKPADRHLTAKPPALVLPRPQHLPEPPLGFGHRTAQRPGAIAGARARFFLHH